MKEICKPANKWQSQEAPKQNDYPKPPNGMLEEYLYYSLYVKMLSYLKDHTMLLGVSKHARCIVIGNENRRGFGHVTIDHKNINETSLKKFEKVKDITLSGLAKVSKINMSKWLTKVLEINDLKACQEIYLPRSLDQLILRDLPNLSRIYGLEHTQVTTIILENLPKISVINLPECVEEIKMNSLHSLFKVSGLGQKHKSLREFYLRETPIYHIDLPNKLDYLTLSGIDNINNLNELIGKREIGKLRLEYCEAIHDLSFLAKAKIGKIVLVDLPIKSISSIKSVKEMYLGFQIYLENIDALADMPELERLTLRQLPRIERLPKLSGKLQYLEIYSLYRLQSLSFLEELKGLQQLFIDDLPNLSDLSHIKKHHNVYIDFELQDSTIEEEVNDDENDQQTDIELQDSPTDSVKEENVEVPCCGDDGPTQQEVTLTSSIEQINEDVKEFDEKTKKCPWRESKTYDRNKSYTSIYYRVDSPLSDYKIYDLMHSLPHLSDRIKKHREDLVELVESSQRAYSKLSHYVLMKELKRKATREKKIPFGLLEQLPVCQTNNTFDKQLQSKLNIEKELYNAYKNTLLERKMSCDLEMRGYRLLNKKIPKIRQEKSKEFEAWQSNTCKKFRQSIFLSNKEFLNLKENINKEYESLNNDIQKALSLDVLKQSIKSQSFILDKKINRLIYNAKLVLRSLLLKKYNDLKKNMDYILSEINENNKRIIRSTGVVLAKKTNGIYIPEGNATIMHKTIKEKKHLIFLVTNKHIVDKVYFNSFIFRTNEENSRLIYLYKNCKGVRLWQHDVPDTEEKDTVVLIIDVPKNLYNLLPEPPKVASREKSWHPTLLVVNPCKFCEASLIESFEYSKRNTVFKNWTDQNNIACVDETGSLKPYKPTDWKEMFKGSCHFVKSLEDYKYENLEVSGPGDCGSPYFIYSKKQQKYFLYALHFRGYNRTKVLDKHSNVIYRRSKFSRPIPRADLQKAYRVCLDIVLDPTF